MKVILKFLANFFQKNGFLKILGSFVLLALVAFLYDKFEWGFLKYIIWIPGGYIILAFLLFSGAGIINVIKDYKK